MRSRSTWCVWEVSLRFHAGFWLVSLFQKLLIRLKNSVSCQIKTKSEDRSKSDAVRTSYIVPLIIASFNSVGASGLLPPY